MADSSTAEIATSVVSTSRKQNQGYTCHVCGIKLSRIAHLRRHQLQHSSPKEIFKCHICHKNFNRKDVHQRHLRVVHDPKQASQKGHKKSCQRCIRYKLRCSRTSPCASCLQKQASCIYEFSPAHTVSQSSSDTRYRNPSPVISPNYESYNNIDSNTESQSQGPSELPNRAQIPIFDADINPLPDLDVPNSNYSEHFNLDADMHASQQSDVTMDSLNLCQTPFLQDTTDSVSQPNQEGIGSSAAASDENYEWLDGICLDLEAFDSDLFRASKMDWLGCETESSDQSTIQPIVGDMQNICNGITPPVRGLISRIQLKSQHCNPFLGAERPQIHHESSEHKEHESWPGILDQGGNESWPFDYTSNQGFRKIKLPPLREVLEQTMGNAPVIKTCTVRDLIKVLSSPFIPSLSDSSALEVLPTLSFLGELVKTYFAEFHRTFPIIHLSSWRIEKCPTALLAAMACIGATYSTGEGFEKVATTLAEISQRTLFWMGQSDSRSYRTPTYIAASCLHQIYALGSGNRRLYELADASRGLLVTGLRELGVLCADSKQSDFGSLEAEDLQGMKSSTLEDTWNRWRDVELERRIAWSVFEFDCTLATLTNKRAFFNITELPIRIPCSESLWEAPSANSWASVAALTASPLSGILFYPLLQKIIAQKSIQNMVIPAWGKRICALVMSRLLWDLREIEEVSSSKVLGLSSLLDVHKTTRENLLASLSAVCGSLSRPDRLEDLVNMNSACLTTHYAYLTSGGETMDLINFILRNNYASKHDPSSSEIAKELSRAKSHIRLRFARNPVTTRQCVHHAALAIATSREYTSFAPSEIMCVFYSFSFLLFFARYFPFEKASSNTNEGSTVRLDELPIKQYQANDHPERLARWIEHGGTASFASIDDICNMRNFEVLREDALEAMDHLSVWGLAKKFRRVLQNFDVN